MNELSQLTRQHYEKNEAGTSLVSKVATILDSLPAGPVDASQLAGLDQFHVAQRTGLNVLVSYQAGDLLALPFPDSGFDVVWTQHVVMNIPAWSLPARFPLRRNRIR